MQIQSFCLIIRDTCLYAGFGEFISKLKIHADIDDMNDFFLGQDSKLNVFWRQCD